MIDINLKLPEGFLEEEVRDGYTVSKEMKKIWAVQLDLLRETLEVCKKYGIEYFICGGTLLGAVRHGGYIPWDDDLDIMMTRDNYDKFCQIAPKAFRHPYFFQTEKTDPGYLLRHAKIRNSETTCLFKVLEKYDCRFNQGIFIDIFPLDNIPDDEDEKREYYKQLWNAWGKVWTLSAFCNRGVKFSKKKNLSLKLKATWLKATGNESKYYDDYIALEAKYNKVKTKKCCEFLGTILPEGIFDKFTWSTSDFQEFIEVPFEMLKVRAPKNYDNILKQLYGDYHKFVIGTATHNDLYFDTGRSYKDYLKRK